MREFLIDENAAGQRADKFVFRLCPTLPKAKGYEAFRNKRIKINGKRAQIGDRLETGDVVQLYLNDEWFEKASEQTQGDKSLVCPVYEDDAVLIVNKPAGLCCHPADGKAQVNLLDSVRLYLAQPEDHGFLPVLCNRLDTNTGGLVICAKTLPAAREVARLIADRQIEKRYLAVCMGVPTPKKQRLVAAWKKDSANNKATVCPLLKDGSLPEGFAQIVTTYALVESGTSNTTQGAPISLLEISLETGRSHQIRAQMAALGHPLVGDAKYGGVKANHLQGQALWAYALRVATPLSQESPLYDFGAAGWVTLPLPQPLDACFAKPLQTKQHKPTANM